MTFRSLIFIMKPLTLLIFFVIHIISVNISSAANVGFNFQKTTLYTGPTQLGFGTGINAFDFDQDGDVDIFIPTAAGEANQLLINQGNGSFIESAALYNLADTRVARSALWLDYESDGDYDLLIARDCFQSVCDPLISILSLFENNAGQFTEVTSEVGLFNPMSMLNPMNNHIGGLSAGDLNKDGMPDIYVPIWQASSLLLLSVDFSSSKSLHKGDTGGGYFYAGNSTGIGNDSGGHWQALFHDFNNDDLLDLFVNVDFHANQLWLNQLNQPYLNIATSIGVNTAWNEMGLAAGDYDSDGDIDLFISNIYDWLPQSGDDRHNRFYRNDTIGNNVNFTDIAVAKGIEDTGWAWGATWLDVENDGDLDLAVTNGYCQPSPYYCGVKHKFDQSYLFLNSGNGASFSDVSVDTGFNDTDVGTSLVKADFNNDGWMDLLQTVVTINNETQIRLLTNQSTLNNAYLKIQLNGTNLAGTLLTLINDTTQQAHLVTQGNSFLGQEPFNVQFGLGTSSTSYSLTVNWPEGTTSYWGKSLLLGSASNPMIVSRKQIFSEGFE